MIQREANVLDHLANQIRQFVPQDNEGHAGRVR